MDYKILFAPNSPIFRKSCNEEETGEREKAIKRSYAFQANAMRS